MTNEEAKILIKKTMPKGNSAIEIQLRAALEQAVSALGAIEQFRWERDVAISQLKELGLSLGQKVDHVIIKDEIIEHLLDMLEEEHMGMRSVATKEIKDKFGIDV